MSTGAYTLSDVDKPPAKKGQFTAVDIDQASPSKNVGPPTQDVPSRTSDQDPDFRNPNIPGAYMTRKGGPIQNVNESPVHAGIRQFESTIGIQKQPTGVLDAASQILQSLGGMAKGSFNEWDQGLQKESGGLLPSLVTKPIAAAMTPFDMAARGIEGIAGGIEGGSSDLERGIKSKNPNLVSSGIGGLLGLKAILSTPEGKDFATKVSESGRLLKQQDAINRGQVQIVNEHVRKPLGALDAKVNQEVGAHAKAATDADQSHMAATGAKSGLVNATDAAARASDKTATLGITLPSHVTDMLERAAQPLTLNEAKQLTTDAGRTSAALTRQGNMRGASVLNELYDGLHKATQQRADDLGIGKSWQRYIDLNRSYKEMQEGLLGELTDEPVHAKVMEKLMDPKRGQEFNEIKQELDKRGIDSNGFAKAREYAKDMQSLSQKTGNLFVSKIKAIVQHPVLAGGAAAGASLVGHASGIPGASFVLPLIVAGKVAGILDARQMTDLLTDIQKTMPPEAERTTDALPSPQSPQSGLAAKYGLLTRPSSAPGLSSFQDSTTGGSIEMKEGFTEQQLADKVNQHRAAMKATPPEGKSDLAAQKASEAQGRYEQNIVNALMEQFNFTKNAAQNVAQSIRGKYSGLDEGLRMAIAEAVKRSRK